MSKTCFICNRKLEVVNEVARYVTSSFTKNNYCLPGEGCWVDATVDEKNWASEEPLNEPVGLEKPSSGNKQNLRPSTQSVSDLSAENTEATSVPVPAT